MSGPIDEDGLRSAVRACIDAEADSATAYAREIGVVYEQLLSFLRGVRPPQPKLLEALGYRRVMTYAGCPCFKCTLTRSQGMPPDERQIAMNRYFLCETCGNKRCPHAAHHSQPCTGSNEPGQTGSLYE